MPLHFQRKPALLCLAGALYLLCGAAVSANPSPRKSWDAFSLLAEAMRAKFHLTYTAHEETLFFSGLAGSAEEGQWTRVMAEVAYAGRKSRMTYRFPPSVSDLVVADNGTLLSQFQPSCHVFQVRCSPQDARDGEASLALLHRNYCCRRLEPVRLGQTLCDRVQIQPRFTPGPWRVCWIDHRRRLIIRTEEYDAGGRRRYVSCLTGVRFVPMLPASLFSPRPPRGITRQFVLSPGSLPYAQAWAAAGGTGRAPCWLPRGWRLLRCTRVVRPEGSPALRLRFGDGLKSLSVFEEALSPALPPLPLQKKMLAEQLGRYGQQAWVMESGDMRVTVVGDATLPPEMGRELLRALQPGTEHCLACGLVRDFGTKAARHGQLLRRQGWGYEQIAARLLARHPFHRFPIVRPEHQPDTQFDAQARAWIADTLAASKQ